MNASRGPTAERMQTRSRHLRGILGHYKPLTKGTTMTTFAEIMEKARTAGPVRFVVAQAADSTILEALAQAESAGFARPILVGRGDEIRRAAREREVSLNGWEVAEAENAGEAATQAVRLVASGKGDILVKGLLQSADLLRAVLNKSNGLTTGRTLSHVGVFRFPESDRFHFVTDAALTISPDLQQKIDIVRNAVDVAHRLGVAQPIAAMLCAIETVNPEMPATVDAACIAKMADRGAIPGGARGGPARPGQRRERGGGAAQRHHGRPGGAGRHPCSAEYRGRQYPVQGPDILRKGGRGGHSHGSTVSDCPGLPQRLGPEQAVFAGPRGPDALWRDLVLVLPEHHDGVVAPEAQRIGHCSSDPSAVALVRHVVQVALRIRVVQVAGGREELVLHGLHRHDGLYSTRSPQQVAGDGLGG